MTKSDLPTATALRAARALLDGASPEWVADRFSLSADQVEVARRRAEVAVTQHFATKGVEIKDFPAFCASNALEVLRLLLTWLEKIEMPQVPVGHGHKDEPSENVDEKNGASQGETGGNPESP